MLTRAATPDDLPAVAALQRRWETAWFGAPEQDEGEVAESFALADPMAEHSRLIFDGDELLAAAWWWRGSTTLLVDPVIDPAPIHSAMLAWFADQGGVPVEALAQDERLRAALTDRGWQHVSSSFELIHDARPVADPQWPAGITARDLGPHDAETVHRLIYTDAAWADVAGHPERDLPEWRAIFLNDQTRPEHHVLAWAGDRLVGVALGRIFSDGTGWISQLAVATDQRGKGLGRALLLASLRRLRDAGATSLGLSVQAQNRAALNLYLGVGLTVDREWQQYAPRPRRNVTNR